MAEKKELKTENKNSTKKNEEHDLEHETTITLMAGVLIILTAVSAIAVACLYCLNNI